MWPCMSGFLSQAETKGPTPHIEDGHIRADMCRGTYQLHILAALAEFERARIQERVRAGLARARAQGVRLGRPKAAVPADRLQRVSNLQVDEAASALGVSRSTVKRWRRQVADSSCRDTVS